MALVLDPSQPRQLKRAVEILRRNEAVALPTETVYGLAGRALSDSALARIFELKARPKFDPLIVHVLGSQAIAPLIHQRLTSLHQQLMDAFWPGPLTLLFEKSSSISDLCTSGSPYVALRAPAHPVFRRVLEELGEPLAAPSANRFGRISPTRSQHVLDELGAHGLEAVVEGGAAEWGLESTVVKVLGDSHLEVVRLGSLSVERLREAAGPEARIELRAAGSGALEEAPGQLASHYAPRVPLYLVHEPQELDDLIAAKGIDTRHCALLEIFPPSRGSGHEWREQLVLSKNASDREAASRLFAVLRELDEKSPQAIIAFPASDEGLGPAINDRLRRASVRPSSL